LLSTPARQPRTPLIQPSINLTGELIRTHQTQQGADEDLDEHREQLHVAIGDKRINAFKIAMQIRMDDDVVPTGGSLEAQECMIDGPGTTNSAESPTRRNRCDLDRTHQGTAPMVRVHWRYARQQPPPRTTLLLRPESGSSSPLQLGALQSREANDEKRPASARTVPRRLAHRGGVRAAGAVGGAQLTAMSERRRAADHTLTETHIEEQPRMSVTPRGTARFLVFIVLSLTALSMLGQLVVHFLPDFVGRDRLAVMFNLDEECNVPTLYQTFAILCCAGLLRVIARVERQAGGRWSRHWTFLSIIFLGLAADEFLSFHEEINSRLHISFFLWSWVAVGIVFVIAVALIFFRMILRLPSPTRGLFILAAFIYLSGALGLEIVASYYTPEWGGLESWRYVFCAAAKEFLEMMGIVVFIYALLSYLTQNGRKLVLSLELLPSGPQS
jgi:hypothetical protein